ncbi:MAG: prolyl oligopeptidase family serine peptidase, partial [Actinomycetota bacterium]
MRSGVSETYSPGPGYHDRIFFSDPATGVPQEGGRNGVFQHYGVYLPESYSGEPVPLQWWLHWRGGNAHTGAAVVPKVFKQFGEDKDSIVVSPSGRGTSTWYVGRGHVDFRQVWADVFETFAIDRDRVYVTGHSMGGWGSYLLTLLYPDRFAAAAPVAGPVTQGAWTGLDFEGCDEFEFDGNTPCYISANDGRPRDQHTRKILENARHVPYAILHGTSDELVPYSGVFRQAERLVDLRYRHRLYTYPGYEHYSHPAADQWAEAASYLHSFARPANPAHVTYIRSMPFETATEEVQSGGATLTFDFDSAYWMSELTPVDPARGIASFDGRSLAIPEEPYVVAPDTGAPTAPGQTGPYVITGLQWLDDPTTTAPESSNAFHATLAEASAVRLDLARMSIDASQPVSGSITTAAPLELRLDGGWTSVPSVTIDGGATAAQLNNGVLTFAVPTGTHEIVVTPSAEPEPPRESALSLVIAGNGSKRTLTATLSDAQTGAGLAGCTIVFTANGTEIGSAVTDDGGIARQDAPPGYRGNDITFTAIFGGAKGHSGSTASQRV